MDKAITQLKICCCNAVALCANVLQLPPLPAYSETFAKLHHVHNGWHLKVQAQQLSTLRYISTSRW
eukprot:19116-Heterococcus_DN1.PRE.2